MHDLTDQRDVWPRLEECQRRFASNYLKAPPQAYDWQISAFRQRRLIAKANGRPFLEQPPQHQETKREKLLREYQEALQKLQVPEIPKEVYSLFYAQPTYFYTHVSGSHVRQGVVAVGNLIYGINRHADHPNPDAIPPAPTESQFPSLPSEEPSDLPAEIYEGNQDTSQEDADATSSLAGNAVFNIQRHIIRDRS